MNAFFAIIVALLFGVHADSDSAKAHAATQLSYAVVVSKDAPKPEPKPEPKPNPGEQKVVAPCKCEGKGSCECGDKCECKAGRWVWHKLTSTSGEHRYTVGENVTHTKKFELRDVRTCTRRGCTIKREWVEVK